MVYPMDSLAIIAPITFIVLLVMFFGIGLLGGWKRGVFWGCGNLLGYVVVILIYRLAGGAITDLIVPKIIDLLKQYGDFKSAQLTPVIKTALAPVLFLVFFFLWEFILLINYKTWYKKVTGLKREILAKKRVKYCKKHNIKIEVDPQNPKHLKYKLTQFDLDRVQTKQYKTANILLGGISLLALTIPTTTAFAQTVSSLTTTTSTRTTKFTSFVFDFTKNVNQSSTWLSYYDSNYADTMDGTLATAKSLMKSVPEYTLIFSTSDTTKLENLPGLFVAIMTYTAYNTAALSAFNTVSTMTTGFDEAGKNNVQAFAQNLITKWNDLFDYDETTKTKKVPEINNTDVQKVLNTKEILNVITPILVKKYPSESSGVQFTTTIIDAIEADKKKYIELIYEGIANGTSITLPNVDASGSPWVIELGGKIKKLTLSKSVKDSIIDGPFQILNKTQIAENEEYLTKLKAQVEKIIGLFFEFK